MLQKVTAGKITWSRLALGESMVMTTLLLRKSRVITNVDTAAITENTPDIKRNAVNQILMESAMMRSPQASLCFPSRASWMKCQPWREVEVENSSRDIVFHRGLILDLETRGQSKITDPFISY